MKRFVYVIMYSSGSWDSYHSWIGGIFENPVEAEEVCKKMNDNIKIVKSECPVQKNEEDMSEEEEEIYYEWWSKNHAASEWNEAIVKEYELNKNLNELV